MANSNTKIVNMALGKIGANRINNIDDTAENSLSAILARLHFEQTRDSLIRSHRWRFAAARVTLSQDTVSPDFEFDNQFILPTDFAAIKSIFGENGTASENVRFTYAIEGQRLLTNESTVELRYTKRVTDPAQFDALFVEVLILLLAKKFVGSLGGGDPGLKKELNEELVPLMRSVRVMDRQESYGIGRANNRPWTDIRVQGGSTSLRSRG